MKKKKEQITRFIMQHKKAALAVADSLIVPFLLLCKFLTSFMMTNGWSCIYARFGFQCAGCGGTRCVSSLLKGDIIAAIKFNPLVVAGIVLLILTFVLLHLFVFFNSSASERILKVLYSKKAGYIYLAIFMTFFFVRNIPWYIDVIKLVVSVITGEYTPPVT